MKILIIKTSSLGDIIQAFPTLQYLRQKFPTAQIDWIVERSFADLVKAHPDINGVFCVDTQTWRKAICSREHIKQMISFYKTLRCPVYDVVFDLQGNIKSGMISLLVKGKAKVGFGSKTVKELPNILFTNYRFNPPMENNIRADYLFLAQNFFKDFSQYEEKGISLKIDTMQRQWIEKILENDAIHNKIKVMICPGSAWRNKQMEPKALSDFLHLLHNELKCSFLFLWGNAEERKLAFDLQASFHENALLLERMPLPVLQNLMVHMHWVVAMDSLPLHLAGTTKASTFSIFGSSLAAKFKPEGKQHLAMQGLCPYGRTFAKRCPILRTCPTGSCIRTLTGQAVFEAFKNKNIL